jgi:hypothetical protein
VKSTTPFISHVAPQPLMGAKEYSSWNLDCARPTPHYQSKAFRVLSDQDSVAFS